MLLNHESNRVITQARFAHVLALLANMNDQAKVSLLKLVDLTPLDGVGGLIVFVTHAI